MPKIDNQLGPICLQLILKIENTEGGLYLF